MAAGLYKYAISRLLDCPLAHLFQDCYTMCEMGQDGNVPVACVIFWKSLARYCCSKKWWAYTKDIYILPYIYFIWKQWTTIMPPQSLFSLTFFCFCVIVKCNWQERQFPIPFKEELYWLIPNTALEFLTNYSMCFYFLRNIILKEIFLLSVSV